MGTVAGFKNWYWLLLLVCFGITIAFANFLSPKIGFVRSPELIDQYVGTVDARQLYLQKKKGYDNLLDSLSTNIRLHKNTLEQYSPGSADYSRMQVMLQQEQLQYQKFAAEITLELQNMDKQMMQAVLNQVNAYVQEFAAIKGYDIVFGASGEGNVLYGKENLDLTSPILEYINKRYKDEE